jgi:hypothetical protein
MKLSAITLALSAVGAAVVALAASPSKPAASLAITSTPIAGDYVEARTASVFAGPCHYNGELLTTGRDAVMAWSINHGTWKGVDLSGVRAAAAVTSDANLSDDTVQKRSEVVINTGASNAQFSAMADLLNTKCAAGLGQVVSVRRGDVSFKHDAEHYEFDAAGLGSASVDAMPNHECCKQPELVWYTPLSPITDRRVGFTQFAKYDGKMAQTWERNEENSAFYGAFTAN